VIDVQGVPELLARFARIELAGEVATVSVEEQLAQEIAATARNLAPVDTGTLRDSITAEPGRVYTDVDYAPFVEYGTSVTRRSRSFAPPPMRRTPKRRFA
jgi:hypothetical protein